MNLVRRAAVGAALLGLLLSGCGGATQGPNPAPAQVPGASLSKLTIGISFDQPGIGLKDGDTYSGFDVETAKYVAKALGVPDTGITWKEATPETRETLLSSFSRVSGVASFQVMPDSDTPSAFATYFAVSTSKPL